MKKLLSILFSLSFVIILAVPTFADTTGQADIYTNGEVVVDEADLLTDSEEAILTQQINEFMEKYDFQLVILTTNSMNGKSEETYSSDFYDYNDYGVGDDKDGLMYMVSMDERVYYTLATGYGMNAFTSYYFDLIGDETSSLLSDGDYFGAFERFIELSEDGLVQATNSTAYSYSNPYKTWEDVLNEQLKYLLGSVVIAIIIIIVLKVKMNNAIRQSLANNYIQENSFLLRNRRDTYLYSTTSKVRIQQNSGGGGGSRGGGSFRGSSGRSHSGGGGRF